MSVKSGKKVFVADVSPEMEKYKENLISELKNYGCDIVELSEQLSADNLTAVLEHCHLAIHILSDNDFSVGKNKKGMEEEQLVLSVNHCVGRRLMSGFEEESYRVFAWHPKPVSESIYVDEKLSAYLLRVQQMEEAELLRTTYEDFKSYLVKQIEIPKAYAPDVHYIKGDPNLSIFFLFDPVDKANAAQYMDFIKRRGFSVISPSLEGDIVRVRQDYNNSLKLFDVAIIYGEKVGTNWINMKLMDILKSPGMGREKEILAKAVIIPSEKIVHCPLIARGFDIIEPESADFNGSLETYLKNLPAT
jgi:hypothetical protein